MKESGTDRANIKRQALSNVINPAAGNKPTLQQHTEQRSDTDLENDRSAISQRDFSRIIAEDDPEPQDGTNHHCSLPDSQGELADDLADLCTFKSAGTGIRLLVNNPSNLVQAEALLANAINESVSSAVDATLLYGLHWPIMRIVTADGVALHFVEPEQVLQRALQIRGPSHSGFKRRVEE